MAIPDHADTRFALDVVASSSGDDVVISIVLRNDTGRPAVVASGARGLELESAEGVVHLMYVSAAWQVERCRGIYPWIDHPMPIHGWSPGDDESMALLVPAGGVFAARVIVPDDVAPRSGAREAFAYSDALVREPKLGAFSAVRAVRADRTTVTVEVLPVCGLLPLVAGSPVSLRDLRDAGELRCGEGAVVSSTATLPRPVRALTWDEVAPGTAVSRVIALRHSARVESAGP
ncbi:MAG: hypothetical protein IT373_26075 [Polyangiaceae bacterium]|nr:hypothetical protein [Polyangiaceae bacterium]